MLCFKMKELQMADLQKLKKLVLKFQVLKFCNQLAISWSYGVSERDNIKKII